MTLYRQLLLWMLVVLFLLTSAVFLIQFNTTKNYLIEQQSTELNNVVNSIGFSLSPYIKDKDFIAAESVINATFDSGYYSQVKLTLLDSKKEILRQYPQRIDNIPDWFQSIIHIEAITQTTTLTSGWLQLANLTVTSSPIPAYIQLWKATVQLVLGFMSCLLLTAIILSLVLNKVLRPLKQIQKSAQEIAQNHFTDPLPTPHTRELFDLVIAFNSMNTQLQQHFEQQAQEADMLRIRAYQDPVSGLANRSYLMTNLKSWLLDKPTGGIILLKSDAIEDSYQQSGYENGDMLVQKLTDHLKELSTDNVTIARLNQSEFMLIAPNASEDDLMDTARSMLNMAAELNSDPLGIAPIQAAVGIVMCSDTLTITALLAHADNAVNKARQQIKEPIALFEINDKKTIPAMGKQQWKTLVDEAIANNLIHFTFQKAINVHNGLIHKEMFAYIKKGHQQFNAGQFLSAIEKLNEGTKFDCYIIDTIFNQLTKQTKSVPVAINITQSSINDTGFIRWLNSKLQSNSQMKKSVLFELPEICFIKNINNTSLLCDIIRKNGFQFGIDNYGHNFSSLGYLNKLRPSYVKLDFAYTSQLDDQVKMDALESITRSAHNLSILTIASRVETIEQKDKLTQLKVQGFQGYVTAQLINEK
ncbi:EAL domain-containing protein [Photobacterium toruni]|uniref:bifunctional diguanylate cyclase/phosphodiesterase n=1 Tax=Photobacterium toruni TaxID=1935446 RepID=UPI002E17FA27|nr:EAL domain-containing protein [Photobacterium toruni]